MRILITLPRRAALRLGRPLSRPPAPHLRWISSASASAAHTSPVPVVPAAPQKVTSPLERDLQRVYEVLERDVGGEEVWSERVQRAIRDLHTDRRARVGFYSNSPEGVPNAAANVVTSLLLDPFSEDERTTRAILDRHSEKHSGPEFVVRYAEGVKTDVDGMACGAPWVRDAAVDLVEVVSTSPKEALTALLSTEITILTLDPLRLLTPLTTLLPDLAHKPDLYLLIDGPLPGSTTTGPEHARQAVLDRLAKQWNAVSEADLPKVLFLDSEQGIRAIQALGRAIASSPATSTTTGEATRSRAFEQFQLAYTASNLGDVSQSLLRDIRALGPAPQVKQRTAEHVLARAVGYVSGVLTSLADQCRRVGLEADELRAYAAHEAGEILRAAGRGEVVRLEMEAARDAVGRAVDGGWGRVVGWRVGEVAETVGAEVEARWGSGLGNQLAFESGRLEQIHRRVSEHTDRLLKAHAPAHGTASTPAPFYSPVLMNQLSQLELGAWITPSTLLHPIATRRAQLLTSSVPTLQRQALQTTYTTWSLAFLSSSASWTACVPLDLIASSTATALGLLGSMASLRWGVGAWAKAQRRFWKDWERVQQGLEDDLARDLESVVRERVVRKAVAGAEGLKALVRRRMERVDAVDGKVRGLGRGL